MSANSYQRGHKIHFINNEWVYSDTGEPITKLRGCSKCGWFPDVYGNDVCLGKLPGVSNACCGHGNQDNSYIQFDNGVVITEFVLISKGDCNG